VHKVIEVGTQLDPEFNRPEGATLTMFTGEPVQLMIFLSHPHRLEIEAVTTPPTQFAWVDGEHVAVLAYRLGPVLSWAEATYSTHLLAPEEGLPGLDTDPLVQIMLVDQDNNVVKALHSVRWPAEFAAAVRTTVARMRETPCTRLEYGHALAGLHRHFPTPEDLVIDRADARCTAIPAPRAAGTR
jgi:hypothetical protein